MKAFVFPGQGAQFVGMGKDLTSTTTTQQQRNFLRKQMRFWVTESLILCLRERTMT